MSRKPRFTAEDFNKVKNSGDLIDLAFERNFDILKVLNKIQYERELSKLQAQMVALQDYVFKNQLRVAVIFEGRDAAGKGGSVKRFTEHLNPRSMRVVALAKPTEIERGQWYFRRYIKQLPNMGEMVFFDRSWYNRAVVEPVMGFCTPTQYEQFMVQTPEFEHMLYEDGVVLIKFWFSISKDEQQARFESRLKNPLKDWKYSPVDEKGQELWDVYTKYKEQMFARTHTSFSPWVIVKTNDKRKARLESMRYVLTQFDYDGRDESPVNIFPDVDVIQRYYRHSKQLDI